MDIYIYIHVHIWCVYIHIYTYIPSLYIVYIHRDERETKRSYKFSVTLSFMFNQFSNCFNISQCILFQEYDIQKCFMTSFKKTLPMFVFISALYGGLNQYIHIDERIKSISKYYEIKIINFFLVIYIPWRLP